MHRVAWEPRAGRTTMATDVDQTSETDTRRARVLRGAGTRRARRPAAPLRGRRPGSPPWRPGSDRARRDRRASSPSSSTRSPTGASRCSTPWPRATAWRCAGAPVRPSPGPAASWASSPTARGRHRGRRPRPRARRADQRDRRLHERRGARTPARRAAAAGLGDRGADGQGVQPAHARPAPPGLRGRAASPTASGSCAAASRPRTMNVYLVRDGDGVMLFDAGIKAMTDAVAAAGASLGGITRVLLGHGHPDHRGVAPFFDVPVLCHADDRADAEGDGGRHYFDYASSGRYARAVFPFLLNVWDGGPVRSPTRWPRATTSRASRSCRCPDTRPASSACGAQPTAWRWSATASTRWTRRPAATGTRASRTTPSTRHRAGARVDPQARGDAARGGVGRARRPLTGDVRGQLEHAAPTT